MDHISHKIAPEIKRIYKEHHLEMKQLFQLRWEFQRKDLFAFSFTNPQELKFFIENVNIVGLPDSFINYMYQAIVNPNTKKINFTLLKLFIDVCQDTHLNTEIHRAREIKEIL